MNDYTHAFVKELSAQKAGFEPSPMWGKLVHAGKLKAPEHHYKQIMNSQEPHHIIPGKAFSHVKGLAKKVVAQLPKNSHINTKNLTL